MCKFLHSVLQLCGYGALRLGGGYVVLFCLCRVDSCWVCAVSMLLVRCRSVCCSCHRSGSACVGSLRCQTGALPSLRPSPSQASVYGNSADAVSLHIAVKVFGGSIQIFLGNNYKEGHFLLHRLLLLNKVGMYMHMDALHACRNATCIRSVYQESTHFQYSVSPILIVLLNTNCRPQCSVINTTC